jgi:hypothetical protein
MGSAQILFQSENPNEAREALQKAKAQPKGIISAASEHSR